MQIHVVRKGDTLYKLGSMYSVSVENLVTSNGIENPRSLVVGQSLVIPIWGSYYFVKPGDTLFSISNEVGVPVRTIINTNNIENPRDLIPGTRLYIPQQVRTPIYTGGYIDTEITGEDSSTIVEDVGEELTTIQLFSYQVNSKGELKQLPFEDETINSTLDVGAIPLMVLTNIEDGEFKTEVASAIFNNPELQTKVLTEAIRIMDEKGYQGLDIDFEYIGGENRQGYNNFLKEARELTSEKGYKLSTAVAPKISDNQPGTLYEGHDYSFHGNILDYIFLMTYEWGWVGGPPRAVAPINEVEKVLQYAMTRIPKEKIMMGIPLYGYDWTLPYVEGESLAKTISYTDAIALANKYQVEIKFDEEAMSPYFNYKDSEGNFHEVWFEDPRSIQAKFDLVKDSGIRGFFYWVLGRKFPANWLLIDDNFIVV